MADTVLAKPEEDTPVAMQGAAAPTTGREVSDVRFRNAQAAPWVRDDVSFAIAPGASVLIVGASGRGQTMLLKSMPGQDEPSRSQVGINRILLDAHG